jgi:hypothetical protein
VKFIRAFHVIALGLLALFGGLVTLRLEWAVLWYWIFWLAYAGLVFGIQGESKWCLRLSILPPFVVFLLTAPNVVYNIYSFLTGHPLYQDSPATIFVVAVTAILLSLPSGLVLVAYWFNRKHVFGTNKSSESSTYG